MEDPDNTVASDAPQPFRLEDWQVPEIPKSRLWSCHLRWMVCVMDADDRSLSFVCSCLSHAVKGRLSDKQTAALEKCRKRVVEAYKAEILECQN